MPKVIKPGKKEFIGNCRRCGCEFSYTLEEFLEQYPLRYVHCPECGDEYYHPDQYSYDEKRILTHIDDSPDVVEVVRCKDCKHYWKNLKNDEPDDNCAVCLASPKDDAFCSEGERREDG